MSPKRSDFIFLALAMAVGITLGYLYGSGEGRRQVANSCILGGGFIIGGRQFECVEILGESDHEQQGAAL